MLYHLLCKKNINQNQICLEFKASNNVLKNLNFTIRFLYCHAF